MRDQSAQAARFDGSYWSVHTARSSRTKSIFVYGSLIGSGISSGVRLALCFRGWFAVMTHSVGAESVSSDGSLPRFGIKHSLRLASRTRGRSTLPAHSAKTVSIYRCGSLYADVIGLRKRLALRERSQSHSTARSTRTASVLFPGSLGRLNVMRVPKVFNGIGHRWLGPVFLTIRDGPIVAEEQLHGIPPRTQV